MSVLENFKNIPRSSSHRATGPKYNFFSSNLQWSPWRKKGGLSPPPHGRHRPPRATNGPGPRARQGGLSPPPLGRPMGLAHERGRGGDSPPLSGDRGMSPYITSNPRLPSSFESENSTKNPEKKIGVRRRKAAKPCRIQHLWSAG